MSILEKNTYSYFYQERKSAKENKNNKKHAAGFLANSPAPTDGYFLHKDFSDYRTREYDFAFGCAT